MNRLIARWAPICRRDSVEVERILASEDIWLVPIDGGAVSGASTDIVLLTACERCQCCPELIEQVRRAHPTARIYSITDQPLTGENRDLVDVEISGPDSLEQLRQSLREMRATLDRRRPPRREQHSLDASFSHQANERLHEAISALAELREQVGRFVGAGQPTIEITRSLDVLERSCAGLRRLLGYAESTDKTSRVMGENEANLADCVRRALTLAAPRIPYDVSIKTMLNQTPPVRGKEAWVGQLALGFVLLALDSVKADESRRGKIEIRTHFDSDQAMVVLELRENGVGLSSEQLAEFSDFAERGIGPSDTTSSWSVCIITVRKLGGRIELESTRNHGTRIRVFIPSVPQPAGGSEQVTGDAPQLSGLRVLIIEDNEILERYYRRTLREHRVSFAKNFREAIAHCHATRFDVVICDVYLPDGTGLSFYRQLSQQDPELSRRVLLVTAGPIHKEDERMLEFHPQPVLRKPFVSADLHRAIALLLNSRAAQETGS